MSDIYKGELQDNNANTIYPHTEADVTFCADGETVQEKLTKYEDALGNVSGTTDSLEVDDSNILATSKALNSLNLRLCGFTPVIDSLTGKITGYTTSVGGADTVFPFSSDYRITIIAHGYVWSFENNTWVGKFTTSQGTLILDIIDQKVSVVSNGFDFQDGYARSGKVRMAVIIDSITITLL